MCSSWRAVRESFPASSPFRKKVPSQAEIAGFCEQFGAGRLIAVHGRLGGFLNVNLKVETVSGLYVVRVLSGFATVEHIRYTDRIIEVLNREHIPALEPLRDADGNAFVRWLDRLVMVTRFASGESFQDTPGQAEASGSMLRRFHDVLADMEPGPVPRWSNYPDDDVLLSGLGLLREMENIPPAQVSLADQLYEHVLNVWRDLGHDLPQTTIHGDWHPGNQLYEDNEVRCILDFDYVQRAERLHDVAYALWALLASDPTADLATAFLEGYGPLEVREQMALPTAIARVPLFFICTASYTVHPGRELTNQLNKHCRLIQWLLSCEGGEAVARTCLARTPAPDGIPDGLQS